MRILSIAVLACASTVAQGEVFKCMDSLGKTNYQSKPCQTAVKERQLPIKSDPDKEVQGKAKMDALQKEYDANKAAQIAAEKEAQKNQEIQQ